MKENVLFADEAYQIVGACFEVYNTMGHGFLEPVNQECLEIEFARRGMPAVAQERISLSYKGKDLTSHYVPDFICYGKIVLEIKSARALSREHEAQAFNYLKASDLTLALPVNFGTYPDLEHRRIAHTKSKPK